MAESDIKTDVALIKRDIKEIEKFFSRVENSMGVVNEMSKVTAVQDEILKIATERLQDLEERIETHRKEDESRSFLMAEKLEEYRAGSKEDHQRLADHSARNRQKHNQAVLDSMEELSKNLTTRLDDHSQRLRNLENWKFYLMGLGAAVVFLGVEHFAALVI